MRIPHLLRVDDDPVRFSPLVESARALGLRVGWLELGGAASPVPADLETAAGAGVLRAVAVGDDRTVAVKPRRGRPVLKDLLREHFRGCALVLVRGGGIEAPSLSVEAEQWIVAPSGAASRRYTAQGLAEALRKPAPWSSAA